MNANHNAQKQAGDQVSHQEWNALAADVNELGTGGTPSAIVDTTGIISVSSKGNVTLGSNKNINLEPKWSNNVSGYSGNYGDIALKSGDDIQFCSHHREPKKRDKVVVKKSYPFSFAYLAASSMRILMHTLHLDPPSTSFSNPFIV